MKDVLSLAEVCRALRVGRRTAATMLARGELKGFRRGRIVRISRASVQRLLDGKGSEAPGEP